MKKGTDRRDRSCGAGARRSDGTHRSAVSSASPQKAVTQGQAAGEREPRRLKRCPYVKRCGGCTEISLPYEEQIRRKQRRIEELIGRFGRPEPIIRMKNPDHYRNKMTAVYAIDYRHGRKPYCGIYERKTHTVVPVERCLLVDPRADAICQSILGLLPSFRIPVYDEDRGTGILRYVQVRTARATHQIMVTIVTAGPILPSKKNFVEALRKLHPDITTIVQNVNSRTDSMILGDRDIVLYGPGYLEDRLCGKTFRISPRSFYQVNPIQTEKLYNVAIDMAGLSGKEKILDAYCGTGTIGLCAADHAASLLGVEINAEAVKDAGINARRNYPQVKIGGAVEKAGGSVPGGTAGTGKAAGYDSPEAMKEPDRTRMDRKPEKIRFVCADAGEFMVQMAESGDRPDVVFMDPPRAGASEDFLHALLTLAPSRIVYISCNPETLERDLGVLCAESYYMKKAVPVDMFPATGGIECVCLMERRK